MLVFFKEYANLNDLDTKLVNLGLSDLEILEVYELIDELLHHRLILYVLNNLEGGDKTDFLSLVESKNEVLLVDFIKNKMVNMEDSIKLAVFEVEKEVHSDIDSLGTQV